MPDLRRHQGAAVRGRSACRPTPGPWPLRIAALLAAALATPEPAAAFALLYEPPVSGVRAMLEAAARWSANPSAPSSLADGITVSVAPGYAEAMAAHGGDPDDYEAAVVAAFAAWETAEMQFVVTFDAPPTAEINLFHVNSDHPHFTGNLFGGVALVDSELRADRVLTNGLPLVGDAILRAEIFQAIDRLHGVFGFFVSTGVFDEADRVDRIQDNLTHEIGHAIGLGHPNEQTHFDDDGDPFTVIEPANPLDPIAGVGFSFLIDPNTIMRGGAPPDLQAFLFTALQPDDISGRNVLYPTLAPAPALATLQAAGLGTLFGLARRRRRPRGDRRSAGRPC